MPVHISELRVGKRHKYGAVPTVVDGHHFPSIKEALRYGSLRLLERAGEISDLELQPSFTFCYKGETIFTYRADFAYRDRHTGKRVIEDVKGVRTAVYRLKKKIVEAEYGIKILET